MNITLEENCWGTNGYAILELNKKKYKVYRSRQFGSSEFHDESGVLLYSQDVCLGRFKDPESAIRYLSELEQVV